MSSCYSDSEFDYEKQEFIKRDPAPSYYGGDSEAPRLDKNFTDYCLNAKAGEEFLYVFDEDMWKAFSIDHTYDDDYNVIDTKFNAVLIPDS